MVDPSFYDVTLSCVITDESSMLVYRHELVVFGRDNKLRSNTCLQSPPRVFSEEQVTQESVTETQYATPTRAREL